MYKNILLLLDVAIILLVIIGCEIKSPSGTKMEIPLRIPLLNEEFFVIDLVDNVNIFVHEDPNDATNTYLYFYSIGDIEGASINEEDLKLPPNNLGSGFFPLLIEEVEHVLPIIQEEENVVEVVSATISRGNFDFYFINLHPNITQIDVAIVGMLDLERQSLTIMIPRTQINGGSFRYSLVHHYFSGVPEGMDPTIDDIFKNITFKVTLTGTNLDSLNPPLGEMKVCYDNSIYFNHVVGLLKNYRVNTDDNSTQIEVEYPYNIENVMQVNNPRLNILIENNIGFIFDFYSTITATNNRSHLSKSVHSVSRVYPAVSMNKPSTTDIVYIEDVEDLVNIAPDIIEITNSYFIIHNPDNIIGFASVGVGFEGDYNIRAPFDFTFTSTEVIRPKQISSVKISEKNRDYIEEYAKNVKMTAVLLNHFPVGVSIDLFLCSIEDSNQLFVKENTSTSSFNRVVFLDNLISSRETNKPGETTLNIELDEWLLPLFHKYETIFFGMEISFLSDHAVIRPLEKIEVKMNMELVVKLEI